MQHILSLVRRCVEDYHMIQAGETVAVGVSGGKDSVLTLCALARLREFYPQPFDVVAITIDSGTPGMDFTPIADLCRELNVPYHREEVPIYEIVFEHRKEKNPCSMCAKMRRGALNQAILDKGFNKLALGHHYDDAVETFLMSLLFEARISCFQPVTHLDRTDVTQIRPMLYLEEKDIRAFAEKQGLPIVHNECPADHHTKREEVKDLIRELSKTYPHLKSNVFGAMQRYPLEAWGVVPHKRGAKKEE